MKWIGQHIWDLTSRFRNDIYFEGLAETAETRGLVVDANGKVSINPLSGDEHATHVYENVRNDEGATIPVGTPVYSKGEVGGSERIKVGIADASDPAKMPAIGITNTELTTTGDAKDGLITLVGVYNTNISGFSGVSVNDIVYVAVGGGLTITKPTGANLIQNVGIVLKTNGTIIQGLQVTCIGRTNDVPTPLYIDHANQRVGIGTASPSEILHLESTAPKIKLSNSQAPTGYFTTLEQNYSYNGPSFAISSTSGATTRILLGRYANNVSILPTGTGSVGIGTTSPGNKLEVHSGTTNVTSVFKSSDNQAWVSVQDDDSGTYGALFGTDSDAGHHIVLADRSANKRLVINGSGHVGIGTTSPGVKLHVQSADETVARIERTSGSGYTVLDIKDGVGTTGNSVLRFSDTTASNGYINYEHADDSMRFGASASEAMRITSNGNVGIGTSSPSSILEVGNNSGSHAITINKSTTGTGTLYFDNDGNHKVYIQADSGENLRIGVNNAEKLCILESGNVGIGTTSPLRKLHVSGDVEIESKIYGTQTDHTYYQVASGDYNHKFFTRTSGAASLERFRIEGGADVDSVLMLNSNVGIGTSSPGHKLEITDGNVMIRPSASGSALTWRESDNGNTAGQLRSYGNRGDIYLYNDGVKTTEISSIDDSFIPRLHIGGTNQASAALQVTGNAIITGDLTVQGTTVTLDTANLNVEDKNITLNYSAGDSSGSADGAGITIQDAVDASNDATMLWNASSDRFDFSHPITAKDNIRFVTSGGTDGGLIDMDSNNDLVISNPLGDVLLGDGNADVFIGDGTNNVDIRFEQSGSITADNSNATLTIGGTGNLVVEEPTINNPTFSGAFNLGSKLTLNTSNGYILFDYEPTGDTGEYTTEVPLLKVDHNGTEKTILSRISENGGIQLGHDDSILITAGDVGNEIKANWGATNENVVLASEAGFYALAFPNNSTTWSNRNIFRFYGGDATAANNGLYIGDGSSTQFIDLDRNLKNIGAITATGDFNLTNGFYLAHNEGMRLGETGNASTSWTTLTSFTNGGNSAMKIKGGNYHHNIFFETTWNDFEYAKLSASYNGSDSSFYLYKSDSSGNTAATTTISTGTSTFAGDVAVGPKSNATVSVSESGGADVKIRAGSVGRVGTYSNHDFVITQNGSDALTIDTSRDATFTGSVTTTNLISTPADASTHSLKLGRTDNSNYWYVNHAGNDFRLYNIASSGSHILLGVDAGGTAEANNVGIGTATPSEKLEVNGNIRIDSSNSNGQNLQFRNNGTANAIFSNTYNLAGGSTSKTDFNAYVYGNNPFSIWTNNNNRLTVLGDGNVGIGTTTPDSLLEISSSSATDFLKLTSGGGSATPVKLIFEKSASEQGIIEYNRNGDLEIYNNDSDGGVMIDGSASAGGDLYVNNAGNVGIGTTSPSEKLEVSGKILATGGQIRAGSYLESYPSFSFANDIDTGMFSDTADQLEFVTGGSSRVTINSSGSVGIGTDNPGKLLDVNGTFRASGEAFFLGAIDVTAGTNSRFRDGTALNFNTNRTARIFTDSNDLIIQQGEDDKDIIFKSDDGSGGTTPYLTIDGSATRTNVHKNMLFDDSVTLGIGSSYDLQLYHNGGTSLITNQNGDLLIRNQADDSDIIFQADDGSGGETAYLTLDGGDESIKFYKDISNQANANLVMGGGQIKFSDSGRFYAGDSNDLQIYHDGSDSYIKENGTGNLKIMGTNIYMQNSVGSSYIDCISGDRVSLKFNNSTKLTTTNAGVEVTGDLTVNGDSVQTKQMVVTTHNFQMANTTGTFFYVPFNNLNESSLATSTEYWTRSIAPYAGTIKKVIVRSHTSLGSSCQIRVSKITDTTDDLPSGTHVTNTGIDISTASTSVSTTMSANVFAEGDVVGVALSRSAGSSAKVVVTIVWEYTV